MNNWRQILSWQTQPGWQEYYDKYGIILEKKILKLLDGENPKRNLQRYIKQWLKANYSTPDEMRELITRSVTEVSLDIFDSLYDSIHPFDR